MSFEQDEVEELTLNVVTIKLNVKPHTITVLSSDPEATNSLLGEKLRAVTMLVWPSNVVVCSGVLSCHMETVLPEATAAICESRAIWKQVMGMLDMLNCWRCDIMCLARRFFFGRRWAKESSLRNE